MSETQRCEPADTAMDGWHWVHTPHDTSLCCFWAARVQAWTNILGSGNARHAHHMGYRYLMPVPTPAEIAALVDQASDALGELYLLGREHAGLVAALAAFPAKETKDE